MIVLFAVTFFENYLAVFLRKSAIVKHNKIYVGAVFHQPKNGIIVK